MKRALLAFCLMFSCWLGFAQPNEVSLAVIGEGPTKEEATNNALRSAVEQAYGVYVSTNTTVLNDEIVRDEIATISSGNIKSYTEKAYYERPDGMKSITLMAVVSVGELVSYAKNHGYSTEIAGSTFAANLRLYELNCQATDKALDHFYLQLSKMVPMMYDYRLTVSDPVLEGERAKIELAVDVLANANTRMIGEYYFNTLMALSYSEDEVKPLIEMGNRFYVYYLHDFGKKSRFYDYNTVFSRDRRKARYFYRPLSALYLNALFASAVVGVTIKANLIYDMDFASKIDIKTSGSKVEYHPFSFERYAKHPYVFYPTSPDRLTLEIQTGFLDGKGTPALGDYRGIITRHTNFDPGTVLYQMKVTEYVSKEFISAVKRLDIMPDYDTGVEAVLESMTLGKGALPDPILKEDEVQAFMYLLAHGREDGFYLGQQIDAYGGGVVCAVYENGKVADIVPFDPIWDRIPRESAAAKIALYGDGHWDLPLTRNVRNSYMLSRLVIPKLESHFNNFDNGRRYYWTKYGGYGLEDRGYSSDGRILPVRRISYQEYLNMIRK